MFRHGPMVFRVCRRILRVTHDAEDDFQTRSLCLRRTRSIRQRAGKVAFRSDLAAGDQNVAGVFLQILTDPQALTEDKANQRVERAIAAEIELVLKPTD